MTAVIDSELSFRYPAVISNTAANGGRMTPTLCPSGQGNNVWPQITVAERAAGVTLQRKLFGKNSNATKTPLSNTKFWLDQPTTGDDWVMLALATQTDTQGDWLATAEKYGSGKLNTDVIATGLTLIVDLEDNSLKSGDDGLFRIGSMIRVTNKLLPTSGTGTSEYLTVETVTPHATLPQVTLTVAAPGLLNDYTVAANTRVSSVLEAGTVVANVTGFAVTSAAGTYDDTNYPLELENESTVEEVWTFDFTDATNFTCTGATAGNVGSGTIGADFAPINPDFGKQYFLMAAAGHGGTYAAGDSITGTTHPAAVPIREILVVPPAAGSLAGNNSRVCFTGESA